MGVLDMSWNPQTLEQKLELREIRDMLVKLKLSYDEVMDAMRTGHLYGALSAASRLNALRATYSNGRLVVMIGINDIIRLKVNGKTIELEYVAPSEKIIEYAIDELIKYVDVITEKLNEVVNVEEPKI